MMRRMESDFADSDWRKQNQGPVGGTGCGGNSRDWKGPEDTEQSKHLWRDRQERPVPEDGVEGGE